MHLLRTGGVLLCDSYVYSNVPQAAAQGQSGDGVPRRSALVDELKAALGPQVRQRLLEALGGARELAIAHVGEAEVVVQRARMHGAQPRATRRRAATLDRAQQRHALVERLVALREQRMHSKLTLVFLSRLPVHVAERHTLNSVCSFS